MKKLIIILLILCNNITAMQQPLPRTPLRPLGGVSIMGREAPGLTEKIVNEFREKIQLLAASKTPKVMEIHKELTELANLAASKKIFLTNLILRLEAIDTKIRTNPEFAKATFRNELYDTDMTLAQFGELFLSGQISDIKKFITIFGITPDALAQFAEVLNALPVAQDVNPKVVEARIELNDIFDELKQKTISSSDLLNRLYALATKLEDQKDYANITFTTTPYGQLTLAEYSQLLLRDLIEIIEKKLDRPTPATAQRAPRSANTPAGLSNIGNSCFMNASLQNLYALDQLTDRLLDRKATNLYKENTYGGEYLNFLELMRTSSKNVLVPRSLCYRGWAKLGYAPLSQQDNDEFITSLLSELIVLDKNDPLEKLLAIQLQAFINLEPSASTKLLVLSIAPARKTLAECLSSFFGVEKIEYINEKTKKIEIRDKVEKIITTGQYLIIHLKRNQQGQDPKTKRFELTKNTTAVSFPVAGLNLNAFALPGVQLPLYKLKGITIHAGSARGGHYTGYVRSGNQWYFVNDADVTPVSQQQIEQIAKQGYGSAPDQTPTTLFYERM
jgi:ubiquitin C-terminal hydrolase